MSADCPCRNGMFTTWLNLGKTNGFGQLDAVLDDSKGAGGENAVFWAQMIKARRVRMIGLVAGGAAASDSMRLTFGGTARVVDGMPITDHPGTLDLLVDSYRWTITLDSGSGNVPIFAQLQTECDPIESE